MTKVGIGCETGFYEQDKNFWVSTPFHLISFILFSQNKGNNLNSDSSKSYSVISTMYSFISDDQGKFDSS